jgi:hypothetical protein
MPEMVNCHQNDAETLGDGNRLMMLLLLLLLLLLQIPFSIPVAKNIICPKKTIGANARSEFCGNAGM